MTNRRPLYGLSRPALVLVLMLHSFAVKSETNANKKDYFQAAGMEENASNTTKKAKKNSTAFPDPVGCRVYLAESSIPGAGLGMYSGVDISENDVVTDMDIPIQYMDIRVHIGNDVDWLLDSYYWFSHNTLAQFDAHTAETALPSFGMVGNAHMGLFKVHHRINNDFVPRLHRNEDPGAGAVTDYHTQVWYATKPIAKGSEIFLDYGERYFDAREDKYNLLPRSNNYEEADDIVQKFVRHVEQSPKLPPSTLQGFWDIIRDTARPRTRSALPQNATDLKKAAEQGTALVLLPNAIRSTEWLETNGQCMDNLRIKPSTIPEAGRGAFAARFISKGSLVAPAPLVHMFRENLYMYELVQDSPESELLWDVDNMVTHQLLLNYCFGHPDSSLLLFPYSTAVQFINHKSEGYNAEIRWSNFFYHHSDWLNRSVGEIPMEHSGLMFDIIATEDILPGDEVFINYGKDWEEAWNKHMEEWEPVEGADDYVHPEAMNEANAAVKTLREQKSEPYPSNIRTACYYNYHTQNDSIRKHNAEEDGTVRTEARWSYQGEFTRESLRPCEIVSRYQMRNVTWYKAHMLNHGYTSEREYIPDSHIHIVSGIPREAIKFVGKMYSSDVFLENTFRHEIGVPEGMFPSTWMNLSDE